MTLVASLIVDRVVGIRALCSPGRRFCPFHPMAVAAVNAVFGGVRVRRVKRKCIVRNQKKQKD